MRGSRWAAPITVAAPDPWLDLDRWVGQRSAGYRFDLIDALTGERLGPVHPMRGSTPTLTHTAGATIPRTLTLQLAPRDTARVDVLRHRILPHMIIPGVGEWPLGRYMWSDNTTSERTGGDLASAQMFDEMFIVDQQLPESFASGVPSDDPDIQAFTVAGVDADIARLLHGLPIRTRFDPARGFSVGAWTAGTRRGQVLGHLALQGGYLSPWFDNLGRLRLRQAFDPLAVVPDLDWDRGNTVARDSIYRSTDQLDAPNRIVVIGNGGGDESAPIEGTFDVPASAPHSAARRGFIVADVRDMQVGSNAQAALVAQTIGLTETAPVERVELDTAPDPRHDGHQVIRWRGELWLELGWRLPMAADAAMHHTIGRVYR